MGVLKISPTRSPFNDCDDMSRHTWHFCIGVIEQYLTKHVSLSFAGSIVCSRRMNLLTLSPSFICSFMYRFARLFLTPSQGDVLSKEKGLDNCKECIPEIPMVEKSSHGQRARPLNVASGRTHPSSSSFSMGKATS